MKTYLVSCFLVISNVLISQSEKNLLKQIDSINDSAISLYEGGQFVQSFMAFNNVKRISDSINYDYGKSVSNLYLGGIYKSMGQYEDAEYCYKSMLTPSRNIDDDFLLATSYLNLGILENNINDNKAVSSYFEKASLLIRDPEFFEKSNYTTEEKEKLMLNLSTEISEFYIENDVLDKGLIGLARFENRLEKSTADNEYFKGYYNYLHGLYFIKKGLYNNTSAKFKNALSFLQGKEIRNGSLKYKTDLLLSKVYKQLSFVYDKIGNKEYAYQTLLMYNLFNDKSIEAARVRHDIVDQNKFLIEDYKNDKEIANSERILQLEASRRIKNINFVLMMTLMLLAISLITLYRNYSTKRKLTKVLEKRNDELEIAKNEAEKSCQLKSKFISNVTHELRTPLYGVVGITSLLLGNNNLKANDRKYLKSLKYSGDYLLQLINEVLEFSKIESDKIELKTVSVELKPLLENIVGSFEYKLKETNNKIHLNMDESIPKYVMCDNVRLSQALINLIGNSVKFTSNGNIYVNILVMNVNSTNGNVDLRFEVQDDGIGIAKEKFESIFENFSQLEDSNKSYQGTGLGLSITKKIVELFDSNIELESEYGLGSTFSFNVNFKIDEKAFEKNRTEKLKKKVLALNSFRILIAEDNKINQVVTKNLLEKGNYYCEIVENGIDAIEKVKKEVFDLVLMDINMPKMGGVEATNIIREFNFDIPIIALTAADIEDFNINDEYQGFNGLITKPFNNFEFFQTIETNIAISKNGNLNQKIS